MPIENEIRDCLRDLQEWNRYVMTLESIRATSNHPQRYDDLFESIEEAKESIINRLKDVQNGLF